MNINELLVLLDYAQSKLTNMAAAELRRQYREIETLNARCAALEADARRYRWLRESWCFSILERLFDVETTRHPSAQLDGFIDANMEAEYAGEKLDDIETRQTQSPQPGR
jgi:hypothetical protein